MHKSSYLRMEWFVQNYLKNIIAPTAVLDVGSYDVNGSYKTLFDEQRFRYTGLDISAGPNVDIVLKKIYHWKEIESNSFDVVISGQALEHIEFFWVTVAEMTRALREGGCICIIAPRGAGLHRYPIDCYRFDADGMLALARYCNLIPLHVSTNSAPENAPGIWFDDVEDSMLVARKPQGWKGLVNVDEYVFHEADLETLATGFTHRARRPITKIYNLLDRVSRTFKTGGISAVLDAAIGRLKTF